MKSQDLSRDKPSTRLVKSITKNIMLIFGPEANDMSRAWSRVCGWKIANQENCDTVTAKRGKIEFAKTIDIDRP